MIIQATLDGLPYKTGPHPVDAACEPISCFIRQPRRMHTNTAPPRHTYTVE
ncbi:hypothetical protein BBOH_0661 [Bifidobacterium bohemicum DSM 22767]|uniref:Uncharacterized protein n=1 Tax=Bifidobacterium bohemicum DSM 22767 TaxID=1437606 RepID=A0A086ZH57_9BIFI|nr:hypothetical protein BBOH_0661 [Bifidobacterium bohemicum DSM 22767]